MNGDINLKTEGVSSPFQIKYIFRLYNDPELLKKISDSNIDYAYRTFGIDSFNTNYKQLFKELES